MLSTKVWIYSPASIGGGKYTLDLYFLDPTRPQYTSYGDYIKDSNSNEYEIVSPTVLPIGDGSSVTVQYVTSDVAPIQDSDYTSDLYTSGQVDFRPAVQTSGEIFSRSVYSGPDYEYSIECTWTNPTEELKAQTGDRIVDFFGKEYELTFIDSIDRFSVPCRIKEVEKEGILPQVGGSTMYRPTSNFSFFQGTEIEDPSRTNIFNRDKFIIDGLLATGGGGSDNFSVEELDITSTHASNKEILLQNTPSSVNVLLDIVGGPQQRYGVDYEIIGNKISWSGLYLENDIAPGDIIRIAYFY
jgi:hypothetical protein